MIFMVVIILFLIFYFIIDKLFNIKNSKTFDGFDGEYFLDWYSVQQFRRMTNGKYSHIDNMGVYIIHDIDADKYYVGQSVNVIKRVRGHFNGRVSSGGSGDIDVALKMGHNIRVALLEFDSKLYRDLDHMEREYIKKFNSYYNGYNRTRGNGISSNIVYFKPYRPRKKYRSQQSVNYARLLGVKRPYKRRKFKI